MGWGVARPGAKCQRKKEETFKKIHQNSSRNKAIKRREKTKNEFFAHFTKM